MQYYSIQDVKVAQDFINTIETTISKIREAPDRITIGHCPMDE